MCTCCSQGQISRRDLHTYTPALIVNIINNYDDDEKDNNAVIMYYNNDV